MRPIASTVTLTLPFSPEQKNHIQKGCDHMLKEMPWQSVGLQNTDCGIPPPNQDLL
jgi:hypothetical protein